ncbi:uncharacterized protein [Epargyreus clarus]|uniref:uncharacterized protein n=1 Tax=Epargyreus clarus TaxID=520877 RepID=UPI003C2DA3A2
MPSNVKLEVKREKIASAYASSMSTSFSNVRRKQLELAAAEAKAKIQLDLIEKKLEYDLAANDYESEIHAPHSIHSSRCRSNASRGHDCSSKSLVNEWMEQNEVQESPILQAAATATEAARIPTVYPIRAQAQGPPVDSILQLAHTLKDIMVTSSTQQEERLLTRLSTPRELPSFAGDYIEWLHFKSAYEESTRVCHFSDSENLWRLRRALKGEARETVTELLIGNTSPDVIMEALQLRYGNADIIIQHLISQVKKLLPLQNNYQHDIITFSIKISNCVAIIQSLHKLDYLRSPELLAAILNKLPNILLSKYTDYAYTRMSSDMPKLQLLAAFLKREAEMVSVVGVSQVREFRKQPLSLETQPIKWLTGIMKKIQADSSYGERCRKEVRKLFDQGYARELDESQLSASHIWYLAHFGVLNPNKTEKLSRLLQLSPYIDELGILRVGGRIDKVAGVNHQARRPTILDGQHRTNLRGADTEMRRSIAEIDTVSVREAGAVRGVDWRFIPPGAPEMGGSWERMIRTVKSSLKVILKERAPHPDTLSTLLAEVEALVNSRPITHVSSDPYYPEALTPNHFLIGTSSTSPQFEQSMKLFDCIE